MVLLMFGVKECLPQYCTVDENVFTSQAKTMLANKLRPGSYAAPALVQGELLASAMKFLGVTPNQGKAIYVMARMLTILFSALGLLLVYQITYKVTQRKKIALISAGMHATNPLIIYYSIIFRPDIFMTTFYLATIYVFILFLRTRRVEWLFIAGICAGLATGSKYPGLLVILPVGLTALLFAFKERVLKHLVLWGVVFFLGIVAGLFISSPYLLFELERVEAALSIEARSSHAGSDGFGMAGNFTWYMSRLFNVMGNALFGFGVFVIGVFVANIRRTPFRKLNMEKVFILIALLSFLLMISVLQLHWTRWIVTVVPLFIIFVSEYVFSLFQELKQRHWFFVIAVALILFFPSIFRSAVFMTSKVIGDTRIQQAEWWEQTHKEERVLSDGYTGFRPRDPLGIAKDTVFEYEQEYDYVVTSSFTFRRYFEDAQKYAAQVQFYNEVFSLNKVTLFSPSLNAEDFQANESNFNDLFLLKNIIENPDIFIGPYGPKIHVFSF